WRGSSHARRKFSLEDINRRLHERGLKQIPILGPRPFSGVADPARATASASVLPPMDGLPEILEDYFDRLWPINRSIAGPGLRASLDILAEVIPTERHRFATGTKVFDWEVPREWEVREAYLIDPDGRRRADFAEHNLHLVAHSVPVRARMSLAELRPHLHSIPEQPDAIPYVLSLYAENWGFCLTDRELRELPDGEY